MSGPQLLPVIQLVRASPAWYQHLLRQVHSPYTGSRGARTRSSREATRRFSHDRVLMSGLDPYHAETERLLACCRP
jgi:hypothetical protein